MTLDILLKESLNGGDGVLLGNDLVTVTGYENLAYLCLFGGSNWMFNYLLNEPYNCKTETAIRTYALSSAGRLKIQQAAEQDMSVLKNIPGTTYSVEVIIVGHNRVALKGQINGEEFYYQIDKDKIAL